MNMENQEKNQLSDEIKTFVSQFNVLLNKASDLNLIVKTKQEFHPMSNRNGAPINPPLSVSITETIGY